MTHPADPRTSPRVVDLRIPRGAVLKLLARDPRFFRDLLHAYYPGSMERMEIRAIRSEPSSLVGLDLEENEADALWEVETESGHLYYWAVMCRSDLETTNPWDVMCAVTLLMWQLCEHPPVEWGYRADRVPLVRGIYLYDGEQEWDYPLCTLDTFEGGDDPESAKYLPYFRYKVADLRNAEAPELRGNLAALLHKLHLCDTPDDLHETAQPLLEMLDPVKNNLLWRAFAACLSQSLLPPMGVKDTSGSDSLGQALNRLETERRDRAQGS